MLNGQLVKTFPPGHWRDGIFVIDANQEQARYTRIYGAIIWPRGDYEGFVMAAGEDYTKDEAVNARRLHLLAESHSPSLPDFLNQISDISRVLRIKKFFTPPEQLETYLEFYHDTFRRAKLRAPMLTEAHYLGDVTLGHQLVKAYRTKLLLKIPEDFAVNRNLQRVHDINDLAKNIELYPDLECIHYVVTGFVKEPWRGHDRRTPRRRYTSEALDPVAGY